MKNREHDVVDPISCDNIKIAENWVTENELGSEDFGSSDWMTVYPPLGNIMLLGPQIDDVDALGAGNHQYCRLEFYLVTKSSFINLIISTCRV